MKTTKRLHSIEYNLQSAHKLCSWSFPYKRETIIKEINAVLLYFEIYVSIMYGCLVNFWDSKLFVGVSPKQMECSKLKCNTACKYKACK